MKKSTIFILILVFFVPSCTTAQQVQWASKVIKFSSDLGGKQNGIKRILGKADAFPQGGSSPNAWTPKNALDGYEFVEVSFEKPQTVKQVAVFENMNAGCVTRILIDDGNGKYKPVWSRKVNWKTGVYAMTIPADRKYYYNRKRRKVQTAPEVDVNPGVEYAVLEQPMSNAVAVRVEFSFALIPGQKQIDAIGISDSDAPIEPKINIFDAFEKLQDASLVPLGELLPSSPMLSADGQKLFFTEFTGEQEVIYSCTRNGDKWQTPLPEKNALSGNSGYNYLNACKPDFLLRGGNTYQRGSGETGFEFLKETGNGFEKTGILKITAYNNYDDTSEVTITDDAKTIIMGIETDMTQGGADLYFASKKEDGSYGFLQSMGKMVNSAADENMPRLLSDNKTLLFASNGFSCYGDYDIFVTRRLDDSWKNWSEPVNLGSRVNSGSFDGSPCYDEKNEVLYFIRNVEGKTFIYHVGIPKSELMKNE